MQSDGAVLSCPRQRFSLSEIVRTFIQTRIHGALRLILVAPFCLFVLRAAESPSQKPAATNIPSSAPLVFSPTNRQVLLEIEAKKAVDHTPKTNDAAIARWTYTALQEFHYSQRSMDDPISGKILDRYLQLLDPGRMYFLESDLAEFEKYRNELEDDIIRRGNIMPAHLIFNRLQERTEMRVDYVGELLSTSSFEFAGNDRYNLDRKLAPRPRNLEEAKELWKQHLRYEILQEKLANEPAEVIVNKITKRYVNILRALKHEDGDDVLELFLDALASVYDPHTDYMGKSTYANFNINMSLSLFGIGAVLTSVDGYCKITELVPGPASNDGRLKPNDRIVAVADRGTNEPVDVVEWKLNDVVNLIRGPKDTTVRLIVIPANATDPSIRKDIALVRDKIKLEDGEAKAQIIDFQAAAGAIKRFGVIDLPSFYAQFGPAEPGTDPEQRKSTTRDVAALLAKLKSEGIEGLILDLRRNGGGSLTEAIRLTGLFIKTGPVVQVKGGRTAPRVYEDSDPSIAYDGPMIVLTSRFSASASEILAAALQDHGRALIVGDSSTHGKGTVQQVVELEEYTRIPNPGAVKVTIQKFYRPNGASTQLNGVTPDIVLPSVLNYAEVGESALPNPVPGDSTGRANYTSLNRVAPFLGELTARSKQRIQEDQDFRYVAEDIEQYKKSLTDKTVSLNEGQRLAEKQEADARRQRRVAELKARSAPSNPEVDYPITLQNASSPGLPAPADSAKKTTAKNTPSPTTPSNSPADATASNSPTEAKESEDPPAVDVGLKEAKRILLDYVALRASVPAVADAAGRPNAGGGNAAGAAANAVENSNNAPTARPILPAR